MPSFFLFQLHRYDTTPSILKRPLPDPSADEPQPKRQKSDDDGPKPRCIEDKVNQHAYKLLDQLVLDLKKAIDDHALELRSAESADGPRFDEQRLVQLNRLKEKALEMHRREMAYPANAPSTAVNGAANLDDLVQKPAADNTVLTIFGQAPQGRYLFSSLPKRKATEDADGAVKPLPDAQLPWGMSITTVLPSALPSKPARTPNLGELFPTPAGLAPPEAPKASKAQTKGKVLGFHHPELAEQATNRHNKDSYFVKELTTGVWLDYSNATPPNKNKDRKRERALSLAGQNPSPTDLEMSEMEALFRGAFSSFAPEKDDSGAVISSGEVGRIWYQRQGYRYMQQIIEAELSDDDDEENRVVTITEAEEEEIAKAVDNWDDSLIDPSLAGEAPSNKTEQEKEVDDTLQEISDLIETLSSYQRNRNLTLPTSQSRNAADPAKADMLNGSLAQEPSDEEMDTYQMLKDQLALIISGLPPYAVARLNSDRLEELNVSTKIEVKSEVYKGVMEEDETSARIRHQQQQAAQAAQTPRQAQRQQSYQVGTPYPSGQQFNRQFQMPNQTPVPVPNHYQPSPVRASMPQSYQRQVSAPMPGMQSQQQRPPAGAGPFTRPNGWNPQQSMQPLRTFGTPGAVPPYQGTPGQQPRAASSYQPQAQPGTPSRYSQGYQGYSPQQQQPGMQPQYQQQPGNVPPHMNGSVPARSMSPQVSQFPAGQAYSPRPGQQTMPQGRPYGTPGQPAGLPAGLPRFSSNGVHPSSQSPAPAAGQPAWSGQMSQEQRHQYQLQQRQQVIGRMNQFNEKMQQNHHAVSGNHQGVAGLGGIGIGGPPVDYQKLAQFRANMPGGISQSSPIPRPVSGPPPAGMNGVPQHMASPSPGPMQGASPSPAPSTNMQAKPPTPV